MTIAAKDAVPGSYYRLTRDSGPSYYMIADKRALTTLTKRLSGKNVQLMKADDRRLLQVLAQVRNEGHVLGVRFTRFLTDHKERREMRAYVAFPPDYQLREVSKPPGYSAVRREQKE